MKPLINWKHKLGLMALGSIFTIIGMLLSPISAQKEKFGEIECERLTVNEDLQVNGYTYHRGVVHLLDTGMLLYGGTRYGTTYITHPGIVPAITVRDANAKVNVDIGHDEHGGYVIASGKTKAIASMGINEHGNGVVNTWNKDKIRTSESHQH